MSELTFASYIPLILLIIFFFLKVPIAFSLLASSMIYFYFINTAMPPDLALQNMISGLESFPLLAIPFFITAGVVMNYSGISKRLMNFADILVGHMTGGLGQVTVMLSTLMGGASGSSNAETAMQCKILVPEMQKRGYDTAFSGALTATASIIPALIPPGIVMIIYAMVARVSVGKMFLAGFIPGFLLCIGLMIAVKIIAKKRGYGAVRDKRSSAKEILIGAKDAALALFVPFGILLGLRFGVFTPTEGGAVAVFYSLIVGMFIYKELHLKDLYKVMREAFYSTAEVMSIIVGATLFGYYLSWERIPHNLSQGLLGVTDNPLVFLLLINVFLLILGMFIEAGPAIIILVPLLIAPLQALGIDLVHFGIIMTLNLVIGGITPPFGSMMFISCQILKIPMVDFVKANMPFYLVTIIVLFIITYIPWLVLILPNTLM
ncbi:MAG: TRAP transporter large permease [Eubacteriales bacterium]